MNKNRLRISLSVILLTISFLSIKAQVGSPYSQFGIGDISKNSFGAANAMGGIGIGLQTNRHINIVNPAAIGSLDSMTVIYELGVSGESNQISSNLDNMNKYGTNIDHLAFGFKVNKYYATTFGIIPTSNVDYTFKNKYYTTYSDTIYNFFHGSGGLNSVFWTNAFNVNDKLSFGVETKLIFGAINNIKTIVFSQTQSTHRNIKIDEQKNISGFKFKFGTQYTLDLPKEYHLTLGATYEYQAKVNATTDTLAGTLASAYLPDDPTYYQNFYLDEINPSSLHASETKGKVSMPASYGFGFTLNKPNLLTFGADFQYQNWGAIDEIDYNTTFDNNIAIRSGFQFIPDYDNINYYFKRISYRFGGHYIKSHLNVYDTQINDYGISFGVGLPLRNTKTSFSITFEYGQRGTLDNENLLRETYGIVSLNLSLSDIWFVKRKFN